MAISSAIREYVRQRAKFSCEYCGVSETDTGSELTIDHFQPVSQGGNDHLDNLVYCCMRCNQYKRNYWPRSSQDGDLWNPRLESVVQHFLLIDNGLLEPLSAKAMFTIRLLRLNRRDLVAHRLPKQQEASRARVLEQLYDVIQGFEHLANQQTKLIDEQRKLLEAQAHLLRRLIGF